ncbi:hypothetical protein [Streptomyces sp. NPDC092307]|uniref:hypothetical protein n=1 Tax=Streptomyces sp. NPDC092307 TaxID=3366013 RepID=UPI0037FAE76B
MDKFYAAVAGAFVTLFLTPMVHPLAKRLEAISRRIYKIKPVVVLVEPPKIRSLPLPIGDPPKGTVATCPVGGAELNPRRVQVDLERGAATWVNPEGDPIRALNLSPAPGETEQFHIYAHAAAGRYPWRLELPLLVDGKRLTVRVEDDGEPFVTYGSSGFSEYLWHDDQWVAREST